MKLTTILLVATILQTSARSTAQTVSYSGHAVPLQQVLGEIKRQTSYVFFYDLADLAATHPVSVELKDAPLRQALNAVLTDQPLDFYVQGNTIFLIKKLAPATSSPLPPPGDIHGRVTDSAGAPLAGASVTIKGTRRVPQPMRMAISSSGVSIATPR